MAIIRPVTELQRKVGELSRLAKETKEPIYLTRTVPSILCSSTPIPSPRFRSARKKCIKTRNSESSLKSTRTGAVMNSDELIKKVGVNIQEKAALIWNGSRPESWCIKGRRLESPAPLLGES